MSLMTLQDFRPLHVHGALESKVYDSVLAELDQIEDDIHKLVSIRLSYFDEVATQIVAIFRLLVLSAIDQSSISI